ncbi:helix-turn-helix domain-containing protein [Archangium lansingense]|uniref:Helix-turn-helix transcriptional regulator n=1 Tax=Archangium lansingense TaxID=2995310 RepID=A0ABT3ZW51_9BACT|nr:helix-turn-helix transcriptional regulator [Archangium lansinium]MCY1073633.1 helix-turn-helix transcriptional regulator [Archangium lansinium]
MDVTPDKPRTEDPQTVAVRRSFGKAARAARLRLGLTQAQVARRAGTTSDVYGRVERGDMMPSVPSLLRLCDALETSPDVLLSQGSAVGQVSEAASTPAPDEPPEVSRIVRLLRGWSRERLVLLRKLVELADLELHR